MVNISKPVLYLSAIGSTCVTALLVRDFITNPGPKVEDVKEVMAEGKVVLITGANTGIGQETALQMAKKKAKVIMACRDIEKCEKAREEIVLQTLNKHVYCRYCDLASQSSIRKFADRIKQEHNRLDILINNAAVMRCPYSKTKEGIEMQLGVNHMGHFLLTNLLLDKIKESAPSRILNITCFAYYNGEINKEDLNSENNYDNGDAYTQSKLANVLFTKELAYRLRGTGVTVNSVDPGFTETELSRHIDVCNSFWGYLMDPFFWPFRKTPRQAAEIVMYTSLSPKLQTVTGKYFNGPKELEVTRLGNHPTLAKWLWLTSEKWTKLEPSK